MYSILLLNGYEWWASRRTFERLLDYALAEGFLTADFDRWRDVAAFSAGFDFLDESPEEAAQLTAGLRDAAQKQLLSLGQGSLSAVDDAYRGRLMQLLDAVAGQDHR